MQHLSTKRIIVAILTFSLALLLLRCAKVTENTGGFFSPRETVTASRLNLRKGAGDTEPILAVLERGDRLRILARKGAWIHVVTDKGQKGWVHGGYVTGTGKAPQTGTGSSPAVTPSMETASSPDRVPPVAAPPEAADSPLFEDAPSGLGGDPEVADSPLFEDAPSELGAEPEASEKPPDRKKPALFEAFP